LLRKLTRNSESAGHSPDLDKQIEFEWLDLVRAECNWNGDFAVPGAKASANAREK
jgi:hypothetical protein